jgi:hypothetical protein
MAQAKLPEGLKSEPAIRDGKVVTRYTTSDGYRFTDAKRAKAHQQTVNKRKGATS